MCERECECERVGECEGERVNDCCSRVRPGTWLWARSVVYWKISFTPLFLRPPARCCRVLASLMPLILLPPSLTLTSVLMLLILTSMPMLLEVLSSANGCEDHGINPCCCGCRCSCGCRCNCGCRCGDEYV